MWAVLVIGVGVLSTTLAQSEVLARLPLQNFLKNDLHADRSASSAFFFWAGMAWYLKPLAGILTDAFPLFGSRRRAYILLGASLAAVLWFVLIVTPRDYHDMLLMVIAINAFMMIASTVIGGCMVEVAQATAGSGRLSAVRQVIQQGCIIVTGPVAGYLAGLAFGWTPAVCGTIMLLLVPVTLLFLRERPMRVNTRALLANARGQLGNIASARTMWAAAGLMALFYIAPGFSTVLFYKQQNELHLATRAQGYLQLIGGLCGVLAAVAYGFACRRWNLRVLLIGGLLLSTLVNLGYVFYSSFDRAQVIDGVNGFGFTLAELALIDLAVRATPAGSEGVGFSLMVSVRNLALFGTDWFGSILMDRYHYEFSTLVIANSATTLVAVPLVFLLRRSMVGHRDAEMR